MENVQSQAKKHGHGHDITRHETTILEKLGHYMVMI